MNYSRFLTSIAANRKPCIINSLSWALYDPNMVYLAGGMPNPQWFPFKETLVKLKDGSTLNLDAEVMNDVLQYGSVSGYPPLVQQLKDLTQRLHFPPRWTDTELLVTSGSQDGLARTIEMMISENDHVLLQTPANARLLSILDPYQPRYLIISGDSSGMDSLSLQAILSRWSPEVKHQSEDAPKFLYVNPNDNPTGVSLSAERRKRIYEIACTYDLIILEDDPYYFLQFDGVKEVPASFLSIDSEGRVLRFDTFSLVLGPGLRLGFIVGPKPLIAAVCNDIDTSALQTEGLTQAIVSKLLEMWGTEGLLKHGAEIQNFLRSQ